MKISSCKYLQFFLAALLLLGCGKSDDKDKQNPTTDPVYLSPSQQLRAEWTGIYRSIQNSEPTSESMAANAKFDKAGQFEINLEKDSASWTKGTWVEFDGKTIMLKIAESNMPSIGASGTIVEAKFEIQGEKLRIYASTFDLRLIRKAGSNPPEDQPSEDQPSGSGQYFQSTWFCNDEVGRKTKIMIDDKWLFKLVSVRASERAFIAEGDVTGVSEETATLRITSSSDPVAPESVFELRRTSSVTQLVFNRPNSSALNLGRCHK